MSKETASVVKSSDDVILRAATSDDCIEIMRLINELAEFERMPDQVKMNADALRQDFLKEHPPFSCIVAEQSGAEPSHLVGFSLYFPIYSTWEGISMHLEDIYVTPQMRGKKIGKRMWQKVAQIALDMGCSRLNLAVLGWNSHAKSMYEKAGCVDLTKTEDWHLMRLKREDMEKFAAQKL